MTTEAKITTETRLVRACWRRPVDVTPVWFMRQAGRVFPEYRAWRERYDFLTMCRTPELAAKVTLLPVEQLDVDAAIIFADIMLPLDGLGVPYTLQEGVGPVIAEPIRTMAQVEKLRDFDPRDDLGFVMTALGLVRSELAPGTALIGFAGAPFTLACYMIEGRPARDFAQAKKLMFSEPDVWHRLMDRLADTTLAYLRAQVGAGAQVVQLFDSWVGGLSPRQYEQFVKPYSARILQGLADLGVPRIHFGTGTATLLPSMAKAGADVVGVDWRIGIDQAWASIGDQYAVQGNLDPAVLLGPFDTVAAEAADVLTRVGGRPGHIFNLGHGVLPQTPLSHLQRLVETVRESSVRGEPNGLSN